MRRIEEQYQTIMADLEKKLGQLPLEQERTPFEIDIQEHELDQLRRQIDLIGESLAKADLVRESSPRIEVISLAQTPITRRGWFGPSGNTD